MRAFVARPIAQVVLVLAGSALVGSGLAVVTPDGRPEPAAALPAVAAPAPAEECVSVDDDLPLPASCAVSLDPTPLPQRTVVGEFEAGVLTRSGRQPTTAVAEFAAGGVAGSCDPSSEVCSMSNRLGLRDDPRTGTSLPPVTVPDHTSGSGDGDAAQVAADLDGDGREELIAATRCASSSELCLSMFTPGDRSPGSEGYTAAQSTGLRLDTAGVGRIRLAAGPLALTSSDVVSARFAVDDAQETTVATFTTAGRHAFRRGDPVRLGNDPGLQQSLCVESPLARGGEQCIGADLLDYRPITSVTPTSFSVDLGVLVVAEKGVGHPVVPPAWDADCAACGVRAESVSTSLVVAWGAPTASLEVATFEAVPDRARPFRLLDSRPLGALYRSDGAAGSVPSTEAVDLVVDDFVTGGAQEIAVAWAGTCTGTSARACPRLAFLSMDDAARLNLRATPGWGTDPWCVAPGSSTTPARWSPTAVSIASGTFRSAAASTPGADLAVAWTAVGGAGEGADHLLQTFDVTTGFGLTANAPATAGAADADPEACATVISRRPGAHEAAARSRIEVAAADLDGATGDELVLVETLPGSGATAPVAASLWSQGVSGAAGPGWRPQARRQPAATGWNHPYGSAGLTEVGQGDGYLAVGGSGSGQIALDVGRLARRQTDSTVEAAYPEAVNPDVLIGWTCRDQATCGDPSSSVDAGVAVDTLGVTVAADGTLGFAHEGSRPATVRAGDVPGEPYRSDRDERTHLDLTVADVDGDSATLGDPVTSYAVGEVQPMMVLRAPPVAFLPIDGSHPAYGQDGWIASAEVYDLSGCYAGNGADTDNGDCPMRTSYRTEGGTETSLAVSVQNSWGIDTVAKTGLGGGAHSPGGDCASVCWEATLELAYAHSEEQQTQQQRTRSFRYTTEQVAAPMQDRAFVATSDIEINQVPVYYGAFAGGTLPEDPDLWTYSATPLDTVFSWVSINDPQYGSVFAGPTPGNVLSYPSGVSRLETHRTAVASVQRESGSRLSVITQGNHGYLCDLPEGSVRTALPSAVDRQCAGQQEPVRLQGTGAFDGTDYVVAAIASPTKVVLQRIGAAVPSGSADCAVRDCSISRMPSELPVQTQEIGPGASGSVTFEFGSVEDYQERYAVTNGGSAEVATEGEADFGAASFLWEAHVKGEFEHNDESMMAMVLESATTWGFDYGSASRPGSYRVTPYLADDPATGALALTWTAAPVGSSGVWGNPVWGYGAVGDPDLPARPDPAFSLPLLSEPYRVHAGLDDNLDAIMSSPGFATWACDEDGVCRPPDAHRVGTRLQIRGTVHNYALTDLPASPGRPVLVRFYLGDPARGGYVIAQSQITTPIPRRGQTEIRATWTPPAGFAGQPAQPIYAVIDPDQRVDEVFDWRSPVVLTDRTLSGTARRASSTTRDGEPVHVITTDTDHGLSVGDPVSVRGLRGYRSQDERVLATTATTFTVPGRPLPARRGAGVWSSEQDESCRSNNPWYGNAALDYYNAGDAEEFEASCPTTNNQAYFLTPRFEGNRGAVKRSDLSVDPQGIAVAKNRRQVVVDIESGTRLYGEKIRTRVWVCSRAAEHCSPQLADPGARVEKSSKITVKAGGTARVRLALGKGRLAKGSYRVAVQVIPVSTWERPGGPGYHAAAGGGLADNQAIARVTIR